MNAQGEERAVIKTLSMTGEGSDLLSSRLRVERLLGAVDLHPQSLPPSAILCVRHLRDPHPGLLHLDGRSLRPPRRWEEALSAELDAMARRAARPARGPVGAAAEAVLFADRAELLACLARDALRGELAARWWWKSLLPRVDAEHALLEAWLAAPEHVPGALHLLTNLNEATAFVRALTTEARRALAQRVGERFGAPALIAVMGISQRNASDPDRSTHAAPALPAEELTFNQPDRGTAPWRAWAPELSHEQLDDLQRAFLGVTLSLHRAPATARSRAFAEAVQRWIEGDARAPIEASRPTSPAQTPLSTRHPSSPRSVDPSNDAPALAIGSPTLEAPFASPLSPPVAGSPAKEITAPLAPPGAHALSPSDQALAVSTPPDEIPGAAETDSAPRLPSPTLAVTPPPSEAAITANASPPSELRAPASDTSAPVWPAPIEDQPSPAPRARPWGAPVRTSFGGVFFLINLGQHLGLYSDFSAPLTPGIDLPLWDFLALLGRDLAGEALTADPIWPLLADLAGRDDSTPPGAGFTPPPDWQIPPGWLRPFTDAPADRARFEAAAPPPGEGVSPLDRWLGLLLPYTRARLARALAVPPEEVGRVVCALPARVHLTVTHLDLMMSLADLPLEVRLAGLDRDPGWVPAAGRYVAFHFD